MRNFQFSVCVCISQIVGGELRSEWRWKTETNVSTSQTVRSHICIILHCTHIRSHNLMISGCNNVQSELIVCSVYMMLMRKFIAFHYFHSMKTAYLRNCILIDAHKEMALYYIYVYRHCHMVAHAHIHDWYLLDMQIVENPPIHKYHTSLFTVCNGHHFNKRTLHHSIYISIFIYIWMLSMFHKSHPPLKPWPIFNCFCCCCYC